MRTHRPFYPRLDQGGLTLLELLLVVTILSAVAWMSLEVVNNAGDQTRFEDTRNRLQAIRRAIVGDTSRTLNGQPVISGYVADMGQRPPHLQALMVEDYCDGYPEIITEVACGAAGGTWNDQQTHAYNSIYNLWSGWNGPYLSATEMTGYNRFQDGWGRRDDTTNNFGWNYSADVNGNLTIQSYGADGAVGGTDYEEEYPPATAIPNIDDGEYRVLVTDSGGNGGIYVNFGTPLPCWVCSIGTYLNRKDCTDHDGIWQSVYQGTTQASCTSPPNNGVWLPPVTNPDTSLCIAIARSKNGVVEIISSNRSVFSWDSTQQLIEFKFVNSTTLYQGQIAYGIFEYDTATSTCKCGEECTGVIGDPAIVFPEYASPWQRITILPRSVREELPRIVR